MVLSASRRTDIPCFYTPWLFRRLYAGEVLVRNPYRPTQVSRLLLSPETVDCIVFWTKDVGPMLPRLIELDQLGYRYYFQFTLTPYGRNLEPGMRPKGKILETFRALSDYVGPGRVLWRYDPVLLSGTYTLEAHRRAFEWLCGELEGLTERVTLSFVDLYARRGGSNYRAPTEPEREELAAFFGEMALRHGLDPRACCEAGDFTAYGIRPASCIDQKVLERAAGRPVRLRKDRNQRPGCGCRESVDLGEYGTCPGGCAYCYANPRGSRAGEKALRHDPDSPLLTGALREGDQVRTRLG